MDKEHNVDISNSMNHKTGYNNLLYFPLGRSVFAYVSKRGKKTRIHIRKYVYDPTKAKSIKYQQGVSLEMDQYKQLCKLKKNLTDVYKKHDNNFNFIQQIPSVNPILK